MSTTLSDHDFPLKPRAAAYVLLDEKIREAKARFIVNEAIEELKPEPNMIPIILAHLRHVACLFGHSEDPVEQPATTVDAQPVATAVDPATISLFDDYNVDTNGDDPDDVEEVLRAIDEIIYLHCKECAGLTTNQCSKCRMPLHNECAGLVDDPVFLCETCCFDLGSTGIADGQFCGPRGAVEAEVALVYRRVLSATSNCL